MAPFAYRTMTFGGLGVESLRPEHEYLEQYIELQQIRVMKKSIGIDLGTTNSVIAFKDTNVKILRNKENEELTRSCVGHRNGEIYVGRTAYQLLERDPINTILSVKRLMGGAIKDKMIQDMIYSSYYKYGITSLKGGTEDAVAVVLGGKQYTPEQLSAEILKKIKTDAEYRLDGEVTHAVITVPAYFTEKQKHATRLAAQLAGLKVKKLLAEPTAAAIAYGVDNVKPGDSKTVLIYDFGGGTFDLSILNIVDGNYIEAGTGGDRWLGGDDIDKKLQQLVEEKVCRQYSLENLQELVNQLSEKNKFRFEGQMRFQTELAKIQLSSTNSASILIDNILEDENGDIIDIDVTVTGAEFDAIMRPFIERTIELIKQLLNEVGYDIEMIDNILLVGGSSCIPLVRKMLGETFGTNKVKTSEKPMLAIAEGAGILAQRLGDEYEVVEGEVPTLAEISYSTNHNYFLELEDGYDRIIEKQTPIPCNVIRSYNTASHNQKIVKVAVYADVEAGEMEKQTIGFFTIEEDLPLGSEIFFDITLGIDEIFDIKVYQKANKSKPKQILLGRGHKDSKALELLADSLEKVLSNEFTQKQRDYFFKAAQKEIEKISSLGTDSSHSPIWEQIGTNTFSAFEKAEQVTDEVDADDLAVMLCQIFLNEYSDIMGSDDVRLMRRLLDDVKRNDDPLQTIHAKQKLQTITNEYTVLFTLFTLKMTADNAAKTNPSDAHKLLQMHEQIVRHFRNQQEEQASKLLNEAIVLRNKYSHDNLTQASIHLQKN